jgi:hypothetical protein
MNHYGKDDNNNKGQTAEIVYFKNKYELYNVCVKGHCTAMFVPLEQRPFVFKLIETPGFDTALTYFSLN